MEHNKNCLIINGKESVKLRSDSIKFKNNFKELTASFEIYVDSECALKKVKSNYKDNITSCTENYQNHIPYSFANKVVCINDKFSEEVVLINEKNESINLLKQF